MTRISRAIKAESSDNIQQIVFYHYGIGSQGGIVDRVYGGATGAGLSEAVREAYSFIALNWETDDEIFLFGFSRGAFTARAVAGLISEIGVLTKDGLPYLAEVFEDVQHRRDPHYRPKHPNIPFRDKPSASSPQYKQELRRRGLTTLGVTIKAIGVWDTVGSLGTPRVSWLEKVGIQSSASKRMGFYDTRLSNCIENAFQALALDERRASFQPAVWEKPPGNTTTLRQVWFPGVHSNIGGGYNDMQLANITFAWMMSQVRSMLDMDIDYLFEQEQVNEDYYLKRGKKIRQWSFGKIYDSMEGIYALGGPSTRTPGRYFVVDPEDGRETSTPLRDTHEYIHPSARTRFKLGGPGVNDEGRYDPDALKDWKVTVEYDEDRARPDIFWKLRTNERNVTTRILPESPLWPLERELAEADPDTYDYVIYPPPTKSRRSTGSRSRARS